MSSRIIWRPAYAVLIEASDYSLFRPPIFSVSLIAALGSSLTPAALAAGGTEGNITGSVINRETQQPVADVQVAATSPSGSYKSTTDASGHFTILGLPSDTYRLSFSRQNFLPETLGGVTVIGDQTVNVGAVRLTTNLKTIGRVTSRSANSAFQPSQTTDATTISGPRITQALGTATGTNENNLILAAPGAVADSSGNISVRGSLAVELGYQFDGMNFSVPFFDASGSNGYLNNIAGGSGGSVQVVSGSGDATQGNIGAGVINTVPPRGAYPSSGLIGFTLGSPYYEHQFDFNYSTATPNGRFSNYFAVDSNRRVPRYAPFGADAATIGQYGGQSFINHDDIIDNFVYRFGKNNNQSLQALFRTSDDTIPGNYGGLTKGLYYPYNSLANGFWTAPLPNAQADFDALVHYFNGVPLTDQAPRSPEIVSYTPLHFIKFGYNWSINPTTFFSASYANFFQFNGGTNFTSGNIGPAFVEVGGQRVTYRGDLTHQFGSKHTVTLATKYEDALPRWHQEGAVGLMYPLEYLSPSPGSPGSPAIDDYFLPSNPALVSDPNTNPCQGVGGPDPNGCYIHDQLVRMGKWNGTMPRVPTAGIDYHHSLFQEWGVGLRDEWQVNNKLKLDYGARVDGANYKFGPNPFNSDISNPSDVNPNSIGNDFLRPRVFQPRLAAAYQLGPNDSVRASYGRSVNFFFAQTAGTPADIQNIDPLLYLIPPKEKVFGGGPACGSGYHGPGSGYTPNQNIPTGAPGGVGYYFPCSSYAQSLFWLYDQTQDAPDLGGQGPPTYSNYDLAYQHQFSRGALSGFGLRLTGFARRGFNVEQNTLLSNGPPDPVTGQTSASVFATRANGVEKTYGLEFMLTAPDRPTGLTGFSDHGLRGAIHEFAASRSWRKLCDRRLADRTSVPFQQ